MQMFEKSDWKRNGSFIHICFSLLFLTSIYDSLVGDLQHEAELRVHGVGLFGVNSEEGSIKAADVL